MTPIADSDATADCAHVSIPMSADDGHRWDMLARIPARARASLLWLPALGVAARHYGPFAERLAAHGIAVYVHEWRGHGSSHLRAARNIHWGYRELLLQDLPAALDTIRHTHADVPRILGGHSLGGQLACCLQALDAKHAQQLWLVASGSPYWRAFPTPTRWWLPLMYRFVPWLCDRVGWLPGRHIGFGGREARGLMHDWARSALSGRYAAANMTTDLELAMASIETPIDAVLLQHDWYAPRTSLEFLLRKMPRGPHKIDMLDEHALGVRADHFAWMKQPDAIAQTLANRLRPQLSASGATPPSSTAST